MKRISRLTALALGLVLALALSPSAFAADDISENLTQISMVGTDGKTKYGYADQNGNVVIPAQFDSLHEFSEGLAAAELDGKWGYINAAGQVVVPFGYNRADDFTGAGAKVGFALTWDDYLDVYGDWGLRDFWMQYGDPETDEILKAFQERYGAEKGQASRYNLENFIYGRAFQGSDGGWYDLEYELSTWGPRRQELGELWEQLGGRTWYKYGIVDTSGKAIVIPSYDDIVVPDNTNAYHYAGAAAAILGWDQNGGWNLRWGTTGGVPFAFDEVELVSESTVRVGLADEFGAMKYGLYDVVIEGYSTKGMEEVLPVEYDYLRSVSSWHGGWLIAEKDGRQGCVHFNGAVVIPMEYDWIGDSFTVYRQETVDGQKIQTTVTCIPVRKDGQYGCFDQDGNVVLEVKYSEKQWNKQVAKLKNEGNSSDNAVGFVLPIILVIAAVAAVIAFIAKKAKKKKSATQTAPAPAPVQTPTSEAAPDVSAVRYCPHCGKQAPKDFKFCPACGKPLDGGEG